MDNIYAVFDTATRIVLVFPRSYTTAFYVSQGILNTEAILVPTSLEKIDREFKQYDLNTDVLKLTPKTGKWVEMIPDQLVNEDLRNKMQIAKLRAEYIYVLEQQFKIQNARSILHFDECVGAFLLDEISKSDPDRQFYSDGIKEYASIQSLSPEVAYQEINFMLDSSGLIKIRNYAWFMEYVRRFNTLTTKEELAAEVKNAWQSLVLNAYI